MVKSPYYDKNGLKKGAWSPEEDKKLREYIQKYGHWNWRELPKYAGLSRCGKSCRLRWTNYLRPDVKRGRYTDEEDEIIIKLHEELGNKWSMIASKLPGRTDNEIKNRWHTYLKKLSKQNKTKSKVKEQLSEASQIETCQNRSSEAESIPIDGSIHHISGSSPLSLETCSGDFSSMSPLDALQSGMNLAVEDNLASSESTENFGGDFWSEPFLGDNSLVPSNCPLPFFDEGFMLPYMPYHEDVIDFYWDWVCK